MKLHKILIASGIGVLVAISFVFCWNYIYKNSKLPETACFASYSLGNMNYNDVYNLVESEINPNIKKTSLEITFNEYKFNIYPKDIGAHLDSNEVFKYAKNKQSEKNNPKLIYDENKLRKILEYFSDKTKIEPKKFEYIKKSNDQIEVTAGQDGEKIDVEKTAEKITKILDKPNFVELAKNNLIKPIKAETEVIKDPDSEIDVEKLKKEVDVPVKDAKFSIENGQRKYEKETVGVDLDISKAKQAIKNPKKGTYNIPTNKITPKETVENIKKKQEKIKPPNLLGAFTTTFGSDDKNRNFNIKKGADAINGKKLFPGEEFSFAQTAGRAPGYKVATIYENGKKSKGVGGGLCQLSTTAFNAACKAGLQITARQAHSLPVTYVLPGRDAAYSDGKPDFRFKNSLNHPIEIVATTSNNSVTIKICGTDEGVKGVLTSQTTLNTPEKIKAISTLTVTQNGQQIRTQTFRSNYNNDKGKYSRWASRQDKEQNVEQKPPAAPEAEKPPAAPTAQPSQPAQQTQTAPQEAATPSKAPITTPESKPQTETIKASAPPAASENKPAVSAAGTQPAPSQAVQAKPPTQEQNKPSSQGNPPAVATGANPKIDSLQKIKESIIKNAIN